MAAGMGIRPGPDASRHGARRCGARGAPGRIAVASGTLCSPVASADIRHPRRDRNCYPRRPRQRSRMAQSSRRCSRRALARAPSVSRRSSQAPKCGRSARMIPRPTFSAASVPCRGFWYAGISVATRLDGAVGKRQRRRRLQPGQARAAPCRLGPARRYLQILFCSNLPLSARLSIESMKHLLRLLRNQVDRVRSAIAFWIYGTFRLLDSGQYILRSPAD